ncbi:hypothetical protein Purlil1_903 [Purpureocillium lilacinum]|uniref:Uncharacterized protein n=1 Tax=Purpureocillium lilacinum TaxID=33203 RepID=A0ABR0CEH1_PURLI|nr:hypothetical protein Purlil1_903 [Purpureocillium lilacinum]
MSLCRTRPGTLASCVSWALCPTTRTHRLSIGSLVPVPDASNAGICNATAGAKQLHRPNLFGPDRVEWRLQTARGVAEHSPTQVVSDDPASAVVAMPCYAVVPGAAG